MSVSTTIHKTTGEFCPCPGCGEGPLAIRRAEGHYAYPRHPRVKGFDWVKTGCKCGCPPEESPLEEIDPELWPREVLLFATVEDQYGNVLASAEASTEQEAKAKALRIAEAAEESECCGDW